VITISFSRKTGTSILEINIKVDGLILQTELTII